MARDELDRENLLRDATALVERIEFHSADGNDCECVVVGFRGDGALSIYFDQDPVYHFNAAGELRRGYTNGRLLKAVEGRLAALRRLRTENEVQLMRQYLTDPEKEDFLLDMSARFTAFRAKLSTGEFTVVGKEPSKSDVLSRVLAWLALRNKYSIAARPNA